MISSLGNTAYSLNKVNKLAQNSGQGLKTRFYQRPVTLREGSPQSSVATDDGTDCISFSILNYSTLGILQGWKCRTYNTSMPIPTQTCEPLGLWTWGTGTQQRERSRGNCPQVLLYFFCSCSLSHRETLPHLSHSYIRQAENNLQFTCHPLLT